MMLEARKMDDRLRKGLVGLQSHEAVQNLVAGQLSMGGLLPKTLFEKLTAPPFPISLFVSLSLQGAGRISSTVCAKKQTFLVQLTPSLHNCVRYLQKSKYLAASTFRAANRLPGAVAAPCWVQPELEDVVSIRAFITTTAKPSLRREDAES